MADKVKDRQSSGPVRLKYEVVCTYEVDAVSKAAAGRIASKIAQSLARTGVTRSSGAEGVAILKKTTSRVKL